MMKVEVDLITICETDRNRALAGSRLCLPDPGSRCGALGFSEAGP